jgi:hypothetical protein
VSTLRPLGPPLVSTALGALSARIGYASLVSNASALKGLAVSQIRLRPDPFAHNVPLRVEGRLPSLPPHCETTS